MAVRIRLRRTGAKNQPRYRLVVAEARSPRDGRFIDEIGYYDPTRQPAVVHVDAERARLWLSRGAQPTETARALLRKAGVWVAGDGAKAPAGVPDGGGAAEAAGAGEA
ncbi:MAG: 30S ribosomal protein S16 [Clostridia bacterium]|nr:30S ribosomal protein S16 [Clostridia bacterium]